MYGELTFVSFLLTRVKQKQSKVPYKNGGSSSLLLREKLASRYLVSKVFLSFSQTNLRRTSGTRVASRYFPFSLTFPTLFHHHHFSPPPLPLSVFLPCLSPFKQFWTRLACFSKMASLLFAFTQYRHKRQTELQNFVCGILNFTQSYVPLSLITFPFVLSCISYLFLKLL